MKIKKTVSKLFHTFLKIPLLLKKVHIGKKVIVGKVKVKNGKCIFIGDSSIIYGPSRIECYGYNHSHGGSRITIGRNVFIMPYFSALSGASITIGDNSMIASFVLISSENHGHNPLKGPYRNQPLIEKEVVIGNNCWIGEKVIVLPGVHIGNNCVIGAGSVVTKNVDDNCLACGNPARVIKKFDYKTGLWEKI